MEYVPLSPISRLWKIFSTYWCKIQNQMTPPFHEILKQIKPAVVGIGLLAEPADPFSLVVQGTGFVIDPSGWVMTNKHVAELLIQERDGKVGVRNAIARAVFFLERAEPKVIEGHKIEREY